MTENLNIYDLKGNLLGIEDRETFYKDIKEQYNTEKGINKKVHTIRVLLMTSLGRIILQKRSRNKSENPGLYDKTVGGHIIAGDNANNTVIKECAEELGIPVSIVSSESFDNSIQNTKLDIIAILKHIDYIPDFKSTRKNSNGSEIIIPTMTSMYIGYYDGSIKFIDGESCGIETFSLEEIEAEIKNNPNHFTEDIKYMFNQYKNMLIKIK